MIVSAAVRFSNGLIASIPSPAPHSEIVARMVKLRIGPGLAMTAERGFITSSGEFVDRTKAAALALDAGQIHHLRTPPLLYSPDIWKSEQSSG